MDINTISKMYTTQAGFIDQTKNAAEAAAEKAEKPAEKPVGSAAADVQISGATEQAGYSKPTKGLSADEVQSLKDNINLSQQNMLQMMAGIMSQNQATLSDYTHFNFGGKLIESSLFEIPAGGRTPEEARAAISEGGAYSIDKVAERLLNMAQKLAGDDPDKMEEMRDAVVKGFQQAGLDINEDTGEKSGLPQICLDTFDETMNRFQTLLEGMRQPKAE